VVPDAVAVGGLGVWALSVWLVELSGLRDTGSSPLAFLLVGALGIVWIIAACLAGVALFFAYEESVVELPAGLALLGVVGQPAAVVASQATGSAAWLLVLVVLPAVLGLAAVVSVHDGGTGTAAHGR
jgi:hypothetical protein